MRCHSPGAVAITPEHLFSVSIQISVHFFHGSGNLGGLVGILGFAEYLCENCLDLMATSEIHCQDHKKSDIPPLQAL